MIIVDTGAIVAAANTKDAAHLPVLNALARERGPFVLSPFVLAEADYLMATRAGVEAELVLLGDVAGGAYELADFGPNDVESARSLIAAYADQLIGLADASIVVLAQRYKTRRLLTLDRRHFEVLRPLQGGRFTLVPG